MRNTIIPWTVLVCCLAATGASAQESGKAEVALNRGLLALRNKDYATAQQQFEAAVRLDPNFGAAQYFLGLALLQTAPSEPDPEKKQTLLQAARNAFERSRAIDPDLIMAYLDDGIASFVLNDFARAESGFQRFIQDRPDDPTPYLFLAVAHYRQAKTDPSHLADAEANLDKAEEALSRAAAPNNDLASYIAFYRGLLYLERGQREAAEESLQRGADLAPDTSAGAFNRELLQKIAEGAVTKRRPWDLALRLGFDYDTNVILRGEHIPNRRGREADGRFGMSAAGVYRIIDSQDLVFGVGFSTFDSWHFNITDFNVQNYGVNTFISYSPPDAHWLTLGLRYDFDYSLVDNQGFLARHRLTPQIDIAPVDWATTTLFYQFENRDYQNQSPDWRLDRDGVTQAFGVVQSFDILRMYDRYLNASFSYRHENVSTDGREFDAVHDIFGLGVGVPLPWNMTFDFISQWDWGRYKNGSLFDGRGRNRRDVLHSLIFALTKRFNENLSARFQVDVINDNSNVIDNRGAQFFEYNRVIYGISLVYQF